MHFASNFVYSAKDDADEVEEVEQEEEETIDDMRRRHQAGSDDGQVNTRCRASILARTCKRSIAVNAGARKLARSQLNSRATCK